MEKQYIILKENLTQSIIADIGTFSFLCSSVWFNYNFIGGSYFLNAVILIMFLLFIIAKFNSKKYTFHSKKEAVGFINSLN